MRKLLDCIKWSDGLWAGTTIDVKIYVISINIPIAISHYSFYLKAMDDWQTQNKSVGCIRHLPSLIRKLWKPYDELTNCDKVTNSKVDVQKLTYEKLMTHLGETFDFL